MSPGIQEHAEWNNGLIVRPLITRTLTGRTADGVRPKGLGILEEGLERPLLRQISQSETVSADQMKASDQRLEPDKGRPWLVRAADCAYN